jgi:hypothetical protein
MQVTTVDRRRGEDLRLSSNGIIFHTVMEPSCQVKEPAQTGLDNTSLLKEIPDPLCRGFQRVYSDGCLTPSRW